MKSYIIHLFYFLLLTSCSCSNKKVNLVIQNFSMRDSLRTIIKINGEVKFDDLIKKALVSVSASRKELHNLSDSVIVEVNIPELNLKSNA